MIAFIQSQGLFYIAIATVMFLPGYFLLLAFFGKSRILEPMEKFIASFGLSIVVIDFIAFFYARVKIPITAFSTVIGVIFFLIVCAAIYKKKKNKKTESVQDELFNFSKNQIVLFLILIFLSVFIKVAYLEGTVSPTATDMGHHMYWAKWISQNKTLPDYEGMPDFIIGEHIPFAILNIMSGQDFFSAFPVVLLLMINLLGILAVFILSLRIFKNKNIAILTVLFLGVIYAVSAPQAKYVSGGVVGNIFGNYLMPLAFYFYYRAFEFISESSTFAMEVEELPKSKKFLSLAILTTFGLFYTHHLTSFIFLFIWVMLVLVFLIANRSDIERIYKSLKPVVISPYVMGTLILGLIFFFFVFTPTYVNGTAVGTAVGTAEKSTRVGLNLNELKQTVGEDRLALGLIGLLLLLSSRKRKDFGYTVIFSWAVMIFLMSSFPKFLFIDLPSNRIGNYLIYPVAILSALAFYGLFSGNSKTSENKILNFGSFLPRPYLRASFLVVLTFVLIGGISDSANAFKTTPASSRMIETFAVSRYLVGKTDSSERIIKDHNYLTADSWMKLYFMRGYKYPLSRGYFKRYEDQNNNREKCTLYMISNPGGADAEKCFLETSVDFLVVNPAYDSAQFQKLDNFNEIYKSDNVAAYYRK
jgi:hypothetical protein